MGACKEMFCAGSSVFVLAGILAMDVEVWRCRIDVRKIDMEVETE